MHFFYIDEAGCTGEDLTNSQQPVFVAGGLIVRDEGWNKTKETFSNLIRSYFSGDVPKDFELHSHELLSPMGEGPFAGQTREKRLTLVNGVLDLLAARSHQVSYIAIDKQRLANCLNVELPTKMYLSRLAPYTVAYDYLISKYEWFTKEKLGRSARGMVIADTKNGYEDDIASITHYRRVDAPNAQKVKWLTEFTYAVDSHKNPMIQISDLICYVTKKYLEVEAGYRDSWSPEAKIFYRDLYVKVHDRLIKKEALEETGRHSDQYNSFISSIGLLPSRNFKRRVFT
jgi:Protein of unknown function (DUF3800)